MFGLVWFGFLFQTNFLATLQNCYAAREMYPRTTEPAWDVTPTDRATIVDYDGKAYLPIAFECTKKKFLHFFVLG